MLKVRRVSLINLSSEIFAGGALLLYPPTAQVNNHLAWKWWSTKVAEKFRKRKSSEQILDQASFEKEGARQPQPQPLNHNEKQTSSEKARNEVNSLWFVLQMMEDCGHVLEGVTFSQAGIIFVYNHSNDYRYCKCNVFRLNQPIQQASKCIPGKIKHNSKKLLVFQSCNRSKNLYQDAHETGQISPLFWLYAVT